MTSENKQQSMKPATAARKLGIYLPTAPAEFKAGTITRTEFNDLQTNPPTWLVELRRNGPHPRSVVAQKLNVSISGLARGGVTEALTTEEITTLLQHPPAWLVAERATLAEVRTEAQRVKERDTAREAETKRQ